MNNIKIISILKRHGMEAFEREGRVIAIDTYYIPKLKIEGYQETEVATVKEAFEFLGY